MFTWEFESFHQDFSRLCKNGSLNKLMVLMKISKIDLDKSILYNDCIAFYNASKINKHNQGIMAWLLNNCTEETQAELFEIYILEDKLDVAIMIYYPIFRGNWTNRFDRSIREIYLELQLHKNDDIHRKLRLALRHCNHTLVSLILEKYIDNIEELLLYNSGESFRLACSKGYLSIARRMLELCPSIKKKYGGYIIRAAFEASYKHLPTLRWLYGISDDVLSDNITAFLNAAHGGCLNVVKWFITTTTDVKELLTAANSSAVTSNHDSIRRYLKPIYKTYNVHVPKRITTSYTSGWCFWLPAVLHVEQPASFLPEKSIQLKIRREMTQRIQQPRRHN
jgi:hypothetical protein